MANKYPDKHMNLIDYMDDEEADAVRAALAYILMKNTDMDEETIYSLVFKGGSRIIWH